MRTWLPLILAVAAAPGLVAQPPRPSGPIVISPKRPDADPPGFIVIRPGGKVAPAAAQTPTLVTPTAAQNPAPAPNPDGNFDYWFAAAVEGERIGYLQWTAKSVEMNGKKYRHGTKHQQFTVDRFGQVVVQFGEESTVETPEGEVLLTTARQGLGKDQMLVLTGVVEGRTLKVKGEGVAATAADSVAWPMGVVGVAGEAKLFAGKKLAPGASFDYLTYFAQGNRVLKVTVTYDATEDTVLWQGVPARRLARYTSRMEPLGSLKLPAATTWADPDTGEPFRTEFDFPGLGGRVTFLRTTEAAAKAPIAKPLQLFNAQSIRLDREIADVHGRTSAVYKVTAARDDEPGTLFPTDARQEVKNLDAKAKTFELHVQAVRGPGMKAVPAPAPGPEFLGSSFFVNWDNAAVKGHAARAVAGLPPTAGAWDKAKAVERWVNQNMKAAEFSQSMATADNVARTLSGDCTEYAMLGAAMCRAVGVPSRTVLGLVYAPGPGGRPFLAYHMWFEAFAAGQWLPLDPTLGLGGVGPGHIKIADHSWHEERSFAPLFPVLRVLNAKPSVEVLRATP
ncbi:transglutaminase-like domain-containing protein [Urbifossiella limnaea]|uniref:Transglutaminase-like superfamily protein n=1 Tax=Urbifossiella limnaea TaxID=2528023 RepID=A0A517XYP0_9BACT|nr:transglutaminase domain-containing protein [Urbifossiella limnaea]QDU22625.1 Transglutaminase-like superfamily protein [Urbifossiella limnaea]